MKVASSILSSEKMCIKCMKNILVLFMLLISHSCTVYANYNSYVVNPEFGEPVEELNITTFAGQTSRLPCTVKHLQGKVVSWIRGRDLQVLSTGRVTFSTDLRISVLPGTKGRKHRATRTKRGIAAQGHWDKLRIWRKGHKRKKRRVQQRYQNYNFTAPVTKNIDRNQTGPMQQLSQRKSHVIANHPRDKRYVNNVDGDTFNDYGFWERHGDPFSDYDIDSSTRRKYQRKFLKAYSRLQEQSGSQGYSKLPNYNGIQEHKSHQEYYSDHHSPQQKQYGQHIDYDRLQSDSTQQHLDYKENIHLRPMNTVTPYSISQSGISQNTRAFYPQNIGDSPITPPLQHDTPIAIYPQTYYTQDGSRKESAAASGPNYVPGVWEPEDYTLQIKFTEPGDAGLYICQINTDPKISQTIRVKVIDMQAEIVGSSELYVKAGTPVTLTCRVNHGSTMPGFIFWYQNNNLVDYDHSGGRVQIHTGSDGTSQLHFTKASPSDSANYTCDPSGGAKASVSLNVIVDERQAAMQQGNGAMNINVNLTWVLLLTSLGCLLPLCGGHTTNYLTLVLGVPYLLLLICSQLLVAFTRHVWKNLQWPKEQIHSNNWFHYSNSSSIHILKYISIFIATLLIYVLFIVFVHLTTYRVYFPSMIISIFFIILFFLALLFFPPSILSERLYTGSGVMNTSASARCVMRSMSSLMFCCGCQRGYM